MKMTVIVMMLAALVLLGAAFHNLEAAQKDPRVLFEETCSQCHSISIPKAEKLSKDDWQYTVTRMRSNGCAISDEEAAIIVDYLAVNYGK